MPEYVITIICLVVNARHAEFKLKKYIPFICILEIVSLLISLLSYYFFKKKLTHVSFDVGILLVIIMQEGMIEHK